MTDNSVFYNLKTKMDYDRLEEEFQLRKQQELRAATGQAPAAVKLANEIQAARASGDMQRLNDLQMSAKLMDRGVVYDQMGNPVAMRGYGDAVGSIEGTKAGYKQNAENQSDNYWKPLTARDIAQQQANVDLETKPRENQIERENEQANQYQDFLNNKLGPARIKLEQAQNTIKGMRGEDGTGLSTDIQAVVGARNPMSGALPFTSDPDNPTLPRVIAGTSAASGAAKIKQVQGQIFLEAYESLRGAGALTNIEGQKGEQAKARLSAAQSEDDFDKALKEFNDVLISAGTRLDQKEAEAKDFLGNLEGQSIRPLTIDNLGEMHEDPLAASQQAIIQQQEKIGTNPNQRSDLKPMSRADEDATIFNAKKAIRNGADPQAVRQRLLDNGVNPAKAGL